MSVTWHRDSVSKGAYCEVVEDVPTARRMVIERAVHQMGWHVEERVDLNRVVYTEGGQLVAVVIVESDAARQPLTASKAEALTLLVEECGEVIQAATKLLRFGEIANPWTGERNAEVLARELGDVLACVELCASYYLVDPVKVYGNRAAKIVAWQKEPARLRRATARGLR